MRTPSTPPDPLAVDVGGLALKHPVMGASGCVAFGRELTRLGIADDLAAIVTPSMTAATRLASERGVLRESASGLLAPTIRPSLGVDRLRPTALPWDREGIPTVVVSLAGTTNGEYAEVAQALRRNSLMRRVAAVEINLACPDAKNSNKPFSHDEFQAAKVVARVREELPRSVPLLAKLSADVTDIAEVARGCVKAGATAIVVGSPLRAISPPHPQSGRIDVSAPAGGISGPAILPITLRAIWDLRSAVLSGRMAPVHLVAVGGISTAGDALGAFAVGATAVQLGTALLHDPSSARTVLDGVRNHLMDNGIESVLDLVGRAHEG
ncbi:dihydroorotate dehydrogenase [Yimella sp. cx-51]|uniref:dihydroorotate dehydrogenase n=1 Tax=Yimella sp. cx-51 TaxID=2770551 RepID=UPI00165DD052|nr:dihydroorotate dehydrogenase [Yimella sp. cx-51]MBC9957508.1 dihydroorotate dehydrogenase [Yimella sp. cx-51]QTH39261.1 dihydroorotate dehydrogenase [Yimella sp. cx-51]